MNFKSSQTNFFFKFGDLVVSEHKQLKLPGMIIQWYTSVPRVQLLLGSYKKKGMKDELTTLYAYR